MGIKCLYTTFNSKDEAKKVSKTVLQEGLCKCVQILAKSDALYIWENKIQEDEEFIVIMKTLETKYDALTQRVGELHSYDCPCVLGINVDSVNEEYLGWMSL